MQSIDEMRDKTTMHHSNGSQNKICGIMILPFRKIALGQCILEKVVVRRLIYTDKKSDNHSSVRKINYNQVELIENKHAI